MLIRTYQLFINQLIQGVEKMIVTSYVPLLNMVSTQCPIFYIGYIFSSVCVQWNDYSYSTIALDR